MREKQTITIVRDCILKWKDIQKLVPIEEGEIFPFLFFFDSQIRYNSITD